MARSRFSCSKRATGSAAACTRSSRPAFRSTAALNGCIRPTVTRCRRLLGISASRFTTGRRNGPPVARDAAVSRIDHGGRAIRLATTRGTLTARRVIVTVPTSILAAEALRFDPPLPDKLAAAAGLPLGVDDKLFISLTGSLPGLEPDMFLVGSTNSRETLTYQVRPLDRPAIYTFFGGRFAAALEREGQGAMFSFAADELARLLGNDIRRKIAPLASTAWLQDPWSRGSYSYALPGHAEDRAALSAPVDSRLFFAGEATSPNFFSTAHGAYLTGLTAAEAALASLQS